MFGEKGNKEKKEEGCVCVWIGGKPVVLQSKLILGQSIARSWEKDVYRQPVQFMVVNTLGERGTRTQDDRAQEKDMRRQETRH